MISQTSLFYPYCPCEFRLLALKLRPLVALATSVVVLWLSIPEVKRYLGPVS